MDDTEEELNSMEFRLIQTTCALRAQNEDAVAFKGQEQEAERNGTGYASTLNSFFRSRSNNDLSRGQDVSARFQLWLNNLMNKPAKDIDKN